MRKMSKIATSGALGVGLFVTAGAGAFRTLHDDPPLAAPAPRAAAVIAPGGGNLQSAIASLQQRLQQVPTDWTSWAALGQAYVQEARVSADPTYYPKAEGVLEQSLRLRPQDNEAAMVGMAALAAARHDFSGALRYGERARAVDAYDANVYGVIGDAQVELGDYPGAFRSFQRMVDLRPGLSSYARVSYARELRGDVPRALEAMRAARDVASSPSDVAWASYQIGDLYYNSGRLASAERAYRHGLQADPTYVPNLQGEAKVAWARGDVAAAVAKYRAATQRYPVPEYVIALGDLYAATGRPALARRQYELLRAEAALFRANGVNVDLELALFDADHGAPRAALRAARAEWGRRHGILVADAFAWALYANGRYTEAAGYARKALALGTRNALLMFHAGMIQARLHHPDAAHALLARALATNPHFSIQHAVGARRMLARLGGAR